MTELEQLLALIADDKKEDAQKLADSIKAKVTSLDGEVSKYQAQKNEAIKTRDNAKTKLKRIKTELGAGDEDDLVEAIKSLAESKKTGKEEDSIKDKTIENLKKEVNDALELNKKMSEDHQSEVLNIVMQRDIASVLPKYKAKPDAAKYITNEVMEKAVYEDGNLVFKDNDNVNIRYEGKDATIDDMVKMMRDREIESKTEMFFENPLQRSGAGDDKGGKPVKNDKDIDPSKPIKSVLM